MTFLLVSSGFSHLSQFFIIDLLILFFPLVTIPIFQKLKKFSLGPLLSSGPHLLLHREDRGHWMWTLNFLPLMCTLKCALISSLLQELIHQSSFFFFLFSPYNFSLYSFSPGTFILVIGMFMTLPVGESGGRGDCLLREPVTCCLFTSQPSFCKSNVCSVLSLPLSLSPLSCLYHAH